MIDESKHLQISSNANDEDNKKNDQDQPSVTMDAINDELMRISNEFIKVDNPFPVEVFPKTIQQIITGTNQSLNFPIDFIGSSLLYAVSVAIGNTYKVEVKKGWIESAVIYLAIVGRAGTNKSHPLRWAISPITNQDKSTYKQYEEQKLVYDKSVRLSKKEKSDNETDELTKPVWQKYLLSDFTPEALALVHQNNKRGIGVNVDELAGWFKNFNRYNKGSEMEFWLSSWSGSPISIDRKTSDPIFIPLPYISVCGTIQTGLLNEIAKDSRTQNGFIDRILFVIPENVKKQYWSESELNPVVSANWHKVLTEILQVSLDYDESHNPNPILLKITPDAKQIFIDWVDANTDQINNAEIDAIGGVYSKLEIYTLRLSLILERLRCACGESDKQAISIEAMQGAIKLIEYFRNSADKVNSIISNACHLDRKQLNIENDMAKYQRAMELKDQGYIYEDIAGLIGYKGRSSVSKLFDRGIKKGWGNSVSNVSNGNDGNVMESNK